MNSLQMRIKRRQWKEAINQYIAGQSAEKKPEMLPLFQAFMGPHHKYVTSYDDAQKVGAAAQIPRNANRRSD